MTGQNTRSSNAQIIHRLYTTLTRFIHNCRIICAQLERMSVDFYCAYTYNM